MSSRQDFPYCIFMFFDCLPVKDNDERDRTLNYGVQRETTVSYRQPHLVEPMKLRVYEDLPSTPVTTQFSSLTQWQLFPTRNTASRASSRSGRFSMKGRFSRPNISKPLPISEANENHVPRRRQIYRPLQLSIYMDEKRLSDLPEFDRLSFTEVGELKAPPKARVRTQSEQFTHTGIPALIEPGKHISMFEVGGVSDRRPRTAGSIVSTSRPPSEHDALHSHPISWSSLPGIPYSTKPSYKVDTSFNILTPMQEEFSPEVTTVTVDGTPLTFPEESPKSPTVPANPSSTSVEISCPSPVVSRGPSRGTGHISPSETQSVAPYFHTNYQTQKRINQWLSYRPRSNSTSTTGSVSTTTSFAEHRLKRSQFYQLRQQTPVTVAASPQSPDLDKKVSPSPQHQRTITASTAASTVDTDELSFGFTGRRSEESMTTTSATDFMSRAGTIKSIASPGGHRVTVTQMKDLGLSPPLSADMEGMDEQPIYLEEIGGPLRSPGVGIAF